MEKNSQEFINANYIHLIDEICSSLQDPVISLYTLKKKSKNSYLFIESLLGQIDLDNMCYVPKIGIGLMLSKHTTKIYDIIDEFKEKAFKTSPTSPLSSDFIRSHSSSMIQAVDELSLIARKSISLLLEKVELYKNKEIEVIEEGIPDIFYKNINNINFCLLEVLEHLEEHEEKLKELTEYANKIYEKRSENLKKDIDELGGSLEDE